MDIQLHTRIHRTKSGSPALKYFDASTMRSYQVPPKVFETVYCRQEDTPATCHELKFNWTALGVDAIPTEFESQANVYSPVMERHSHGLWDVIGPGEELRRRIRLEKAVAVETKQREYEIWKRGKI